MGFVTMPNFKCTYMFNDAAASFGWSETWYSKDVADYAAAETLAIGYFPVRQAVLVDRCKLLAVRISSVEVVHDSLIKKPTDGTGDVTSTSDTVVQPWTALLSRNQATALYRGRTYFHGVLEDTFDSGRDYDATNAQATAWTALKAFILANFALRHNAPPDPVSYEQFTEIILLRQVNRKVGRPFGLLRGRRKIPAS